jgi:hypothetical protein
LIKLILNLKDYALNLNMEFSQNLNNKSYEFDPYNDNNIPGQNQYERQNNGQHNGQHNQRNTRQHNQRNTRQHNHGQRNAFHQHNKHNNHNHHHGERQHGERQHGERQHGERQHGERQHGERQQNRRRKKKNTESFEPDYSLPDMRLVVHTKSNNNFKLTERDVVIIPSFFEDNAIYSKLLDEVKNSTQNENLFKLWHGDSHTIADDKLGNWKNNCKLFNNIVDELSRYFNMSVKATRFNLYKDNSDWKPYHRDAAAIDERKARTQNITVAVTFGATRSASFKHLNSKMRIDVPLENGSVYVFNKQVNIDWMHGITQEKEKCDDGRISIILWGYTELEN